MSYHRIADEPLVDREPPLAGLGNDGARTIRIHDETIHLGQLHLGAGRVTDNFRRPGEADPQGKSERIETEVAMGCVGGRRANGRNGLAPKQLRLTKRCFVMHHHPSGHKYQPTV